MHMTTRKEFLKTATAAAISFLPFHRLFSGMGAERRKPNVILILADDLGYSELGCYGQQRIRTPNIDDLAREGVRFTQCYSGSPVSAPSRCVLLTGLHTGHAFVRDNIEIEPEGQLPLPEGTATLPRLLQNEGYVTALIGKWGLGYPGSSGEPCKQGFDHFFGYNCQRQAHNHYPTYLWRNEEKVVLCGNDGGPTGRQYAPDLMEREAMEFISKHKDRPFFLFYATTLPHLALQVPEDSLDEYNGKWDDPPYDGKKGYFPQKYPRATYAAMVTRFDMTVGRMMNLLRRLDIDNETIVIFASDNGATYDVGGYDPAFFKGAGPFRGAKGSLYEGGVRVPLIVRWPNKIAPGSTSELVCAFQDLLPTIQDLIGECRNVPPGLDGMSIARELLGESNQPEHDSLYFEFPAYGGQQMARKGDWVGVRQDLLRDPSAPVQLYDVRADIGESKDVASKYPNIVREMQEIMKRSHAPSPQFPFAALDAR
jgi:arylsulfatase A